MQGGGMVKQIDAAWAVGSNQGGMFTGSVANSTWYHVFAIRKDSDGSVDYGFDTSISGTNALSGYTFVRRIGSVLTDGSANIIGFQQVGDHFFWDDPPLDINGSSIGTSQTLGTLSVPSGVNVLAHFTYSTTKASSGAIMYARNPATDDETPAIVTAPIAGIVGSVPGTTYSNETKVLTNASSQVAFTAGAASTDLYVSTLGWEDFRGKK